MKKIMTLALLSLFVMSALAGTVKATDPSVSFTGRVQRMDDGSVRYDWVGTYLQTDFTGTSVSIRVSDEGESWHNVFIDGVLKQKIQIKGNEPHDVLLADGLTKGTHRLMLQKCTEGEYGLVRLYSLTSKGGFKAVAPRQRMIEVIGDSYTCGYGSDSPTSSEHFKLSTENCDKAYACLVANYFDADYCLVAHSGMGVTRNFNGNKRPTMSVRYGLLFDDHDNVSYDFKAYTPDLVIINLGTNDFSVEGGPSQYVNGYVKFIANVRSHYNNVPILCVTPHSANIFLLAALQELKGRVAGMRGVRVTQPMPDIVDFNTDMGADGHPNWRGHRKIAMTLIPQVAAITGWECSKAY